MFKLHGISIGPITHLVASSLFGNHVAIRAAAMSSVVALVVSVAYDTLPLVILGTCSKHKANGLV